MQNVFDQSFVDNVIDWLLSFLPVDTVRKDSDLNSRTRLFSDEDSQWRN